jgi:hypothetical protein
MPKDPELLAHLEWLGYLQPVGLVVSPPALLAAQAHVNKNIVPEHRRFLEWIKEIKLPGEREPVPAISDFPGFVQSVFGWEAADLMGGPGAGPVPDALEVTLPDYNETLWPTYAVKEFEPKEGACPWLMLLKSLPVGQPLDDIPAKEDHQWQASPQARFERLLRETRVPTGLLFNGTHLRLVHAPRGESSGHLTFPIKAMSEVAGRPIFAALHMLLCQERLFTLPEKQRLPAILAESRKYQNLVSTRLAGQVLAALYDLLRGFQAADEHRKGALLHDILKDDPNHVYKGLLTVLLRLVFLLYAEDRGLLSRDSVFVNYYSITGLFDRLRADASRYPDTMDQRYGAWAQLLTLFRMIHDGASHGSFHLPPRHGYLFHPDRYCFLEGRAERSQREPGQNIDPPMVADGVLFRVLQNLLILDGERISYRTLDVEQIGSVYETMMGFELEVAHGRSIAIRPTKPHGAPVALNLEALLAITAASRLKRLKEQTDQTITGEALTALKTAQTPEEAVAALERKVAKAVTPNIVPAGSMVLQPSDERRRSGSHYTPRSLTEPIVSKALQPVFKQLGERPTPEQILALKVCDPAMGSGAFLVEACRQLGDALVAAWHAHGVKVTIPPDEDEVLHARRLVAQRCLYGVDKNPMAVDLAKLSLWLATLAKDHPFTFLDHALRCGDSLVGIGREQIRRFHWKSGHQQMLTGQERIEECMRTATRARQAILEAGDEVAFDLKQQKLAVADESLNLVRCTANLVVAAFFAGENGRQRETRREELLARLTDYLTKWDMRLRPTEAEKKLLSGPKGILPFHWEIEFPEVFGRENGGFDAIVGNPPFIGGTLIGGRLGLAYHDYLVEHFQPATGLADIISFFLRRCYSLLRQEGAFGLIATNTVAQGDTRATGLQPIVNQDGLIYDARRRFQWPGAASVTVSVLHIARTSRPLLSLLDNVPVTRISAYLLQGHADATPGRLVANKCISFLGTKIWGAGFVFEPNPSGDSSSLSDMEQLISADPRNREVIFKYIGGEEFNSK